MYNKPASFNFAIADVVFAICIKEIIPSCILADIVLAEPGAMIGFAGKRVIQQTIGESLPEGFQTAEFLLEHGFIDKIVERKDLKDILYKIIKFHK